MGRTSRRVTDPPRGLTPEALEELSREERRQLVQSLLVQEGRRIIEIDRKADFDDFLVETVPLWHRRVARVRVLYREATETDLKDLHALVTSEGSVDTVFIETSAGSSSMPASGIDFLQATDLIARLEASPVVEWDGATPTVSRDRFALFKDVNRTPSSLDVIGLRWLPALALNKVPTDLEPARFAADALFEEAVYRVLTMVFRFRGKRLGSKAPGSRDPDALLGSPGTGGVGFHAILDCKAARDGYRMSADDERRFVDYIRRFESDRLDPPLKYLVVVSSFFPVDKQSDPFENRREAILSETGVFLAYVQASDLSRAGLALQEADPDTHARETLNWPELLDQGRVTSLKGLIAKVK